MNIRARAWTLARKRNVLTGSDWDFVLSLTTHPARVKTLWIVLESLLAQETQAQKIVVNLSLAEFPSRKLPRSLLGYTDRGVEFHFYDANYKSFGKLLPTRELFPDKAIICVDDDSFYDPGMAGALLFDLPAGRVRAHRGRVVVRDEKGLLPYKTWPLVTSPLTEAVMLTGVGGIIFPPRLASEGLLMDFKTASRLCPTADDVWWWACNFVAAVTQEALGPRKYEPIWHTTQRASLWSSNISANDSQILAVMDHFEIDWRELTGNFESQ